MIVIRGGYEGDLSCFEDTVIYGVVSGSVTVHGTADLAVHGVISGDLQVHKNTTVRINGIVNGNVKTLKVS